MQRAFTALVCLVGSTPALSPAPLSPSPQGPGVVVETFATAARLDQAASSGQWGGGRATPGRLGWDGLHGPFDARLGRLVAPGVYEWSTDQTVIPASLTLSGRDETITDGVFRFSTFVVPAGQTVRFVGTHPARVFVRGSMEVDGTLDLSGESLAAHDGNDPLGQPGGRGGPGAGAGGRGGDAADGLVPSAVFDGADGDDLVVPAGHAYAASAAGAGGRGSRLYPASGSNSSVTALLRGFFSGQLGAGGGGAGFVGPGGQGIAMSITSEQGAPAPGGNAFPLFPIPGDVRSPEHFVIGGAGGGGAGSHPLESVPIMSQFLWRSGGGGAGGGGALGARVGRHLWTGPGSLIAVRGGSTGDSATNNFASPGGAGSGGSILLQVGASARLLGLLDASGGTGGTMTQIFGPINGSSTGGAGAAGYLRLEMPRVISPAALGRSLPPAQGDNVGELRGHDPVVGQQSQWYATSRAQPPTWLRYEVEASLGDVIVTYSDDPSRGVVAGPGQAARFYVQGAVVDPATRQPVAGTVAPWRALVGPFVPGQPSLSGDGATGFRFALVFDRAVQTDVVVTKVSVFLQ